MLSKQLSLFHLGLDLSLAQSVKSRILQMSLAANTVRNYRCCWGIFQDWCRQMGLSSLPASPQTCIDFAAWCIAEGKRLETIFYRLKAIRFYHQQNHLPEPIDETVRLFMRNARRDLCERAQGKNALSPSQLRKISKTLAARTSSIDIRDRAIILLCFACGWRCSELVSLDLTDVRWTDEGIVLWLGKSKTDQEGEGRYVGVQPGDRQITCPLVALDAWLGIRGRWSGPLFTRLSSHGCLSRKRLDSDGVRRAVKRGLDLIGEDSRTFGAHSLRVGMITAAIENGATETSVMQRTGHKRYETLRRYVRPAQVFRANPLKGVL